MLMTTAHAQRYPTTDYSPTTCYLRHYNDNDPVQRYTLLACGKQKMPDGMTRQEPGKIESRNPSVSDTIQMTMWQLRMNVSSSRLFLRTRRSLEYAMRTSVQPYDSMNNVA